MTTMSFEQVWEAARALTPDEQRRLREFLDALLARQGRALTKLDELDFNLLKKGVISEIPRPVTDFTPYQNRELIEVKGKPLSETIIEERG
jgi:hypothetical protein